jgi:L-rhamnose isomerase/sugar isomerase
MTDQMIATDVVDKDNAARLAALQSDYAHLGEVLDRRGIAIDDIKRKVAAYTVAIPSWGVGTGGTRFARFPGGGEPRDIFDKPPNQRTATSPRLVKMVSAGRAMAINRPTPIFSSR